jgi:hypothetical protein
LRLPLHERHSDGALRSVSFFDGWTDDELEHLERIIDRARFQAGDVLITEGQSGQAFLLLTAGEAEVSQGGRPLRLLEPGDHAWVSRKISKRLGCARPWTVLRSRASRAPSSMTRAETA